MNRIVSALLFFFTHTVDRPDLARKLVRLAHPRKLPVVLSRDEVTDTRVIQVLLGHAKLNSTAFYTKVSARTVRTVTSPFDKLGLFKPGESSPDG